MSSQQDDHTDDVIAQYEAAIFAMKATLAWDELHDSGLADDEPSSSSRIHQQDEDDDMAKWQAYS